MIFTTPDAPVDVEAAFAEFAGQARRTVRLHPRSGQPTPQDSSLGGPLLWPADEPWPLCESEDHADETDEPVPMVAVLQIYARDVPELPVPDGADLLQVLWCPGLHEPGYWPLPTVRWRAAGSVTGPLLEAPEVDPDSEAVEEDYLPQPCLLHPERVTDYPAGWELDAGLRARVDAWSSEQGRDYLYQNQLAAAPGTKVGGWPDWIQDPDYPECECGTPMAHLLTIASWECDGESWRRWVPVEELPLDRRHGDGPGFGRSQDAGLNLADAGSMYLFVCESCAHRPVAEVSQCS